MKFTINHDSRIGRRRINQDRIGSAFTDEAMLLVVCDGMGGHNHGEIAAQLVVDHLVQNFRALAQPRLDDPARFLAEHFVAAHEAINNYAALRAQAIEDAPRTTCVACIIQGDLALWAHTGDSRLYLVRDGRLVTRTVDHSHVQQLIDAGEITEAEAHHHPQRNLVFTCLGGEMAPRVDVSPVARLHPGDTFALCSDGVWAPLGETIVAGLMYPLERAVPQLLNRAEEINGATSDNLSLLAVRWEGADGRPQSDEHTLPADGSTAPMTNAPNAAGTNPLSVDEIDRAVADVRATIKH